MAKTAQETIEEDISARLKRIVKALRQREEYRRSLEAYCDADYAPGAARGKEVEGLAFSIQSEEYWPAPRILIHLL